MKSSFKTFYLHRSFSSRRIIKRVSMQKASCRSTPPTSTKPFVWKCEWRRQWISWIFVMGDQKRVAMWRLLKILNQPNFHFHWSMRKLVRCHRGGNEKRQWTANLAAPLSLKTFRKPETRQTWLLIKIIKFTTVTMQTWQVSTVRILSWVVKLIRFCRKVIWLTSRCQTTKPAVHLTW